MKTVWYAIRMLFRIFAFFFAANIVLNSVIFILNISFGWHITAIAVKPYIPGSGTGERIDIDNLQDFLLFLFMFGIAFVISFVVGWADIIWKKAKQHPKIATVCAIIIIALLIPLVRFLAGDIQGSRLYSAIEKGDTAKIESILEKYKPSVEKSDDYFFAIDRYYSERYRSVVPILVAHGFNINAPSAQDPAGATALMFMLEFNSPTDTVEIMLANGASPEVKDKNGRTALHYAVLSEFAPGPNDYGYDVYMRNIQNVLNSVKGREKQLINAPDNDGKTALDIAREREMADIVKLFEMYK